MTSFQFELSMQLNLVVILVGKVTLKLFTVISTNKNNENGAVTTSVSTSFKFCRILRKNQIGGNTYLAELKKIPKYPLIVPVLETTDRVRLLAIASGPPCKWNEIQLS